MIRENTKQTNWMSGRKHQAQAAFDNKVLYKVFFIQIPIFWSKTAKIVDFLREIGQL